MIKISVVIPFHNALGELRNCLHALEGQTFPGEDYEIIAVDNGSSEKGDQIKAAFPKVRWLDESRPGSYAARNKGVQQARGEIIAFTDADCLPSPSWLKEAVAAFGTSNATILGGRVDYLNPVGRTLNIYELFEEEFFLLAKQQFLVERIGVAATANVVTYRAVFDRAGFFDPELMSFGDGEWIQRATAKGEILNYADSAIVRHPRRSTFGGVFRKARRIAEDQVILMRKRKAPLMKYLVDIYRYSVLSPRVHRYAFNFPKVKGLKERLRMFFLVEFLSLANTAGKIRVLLGASAYRG